MSLKRFYQKMENMQNDLQFQDVLISFRRTSWQKWLICNGM